MTIAPTLDPPRPIEDAGEPALVGSSASERITWPRRIICGRPEDPSWARPALIVLLVVTAGLYLWDLGAQGWANAFYSAAVQAGTKSWKAFFFGSFDSSNFITVDKPPAALWVMELSARIFGVNSWSILVPQALEGVAAVGLLYATVKRWFSPAAGLIAGAVLALTPVAALMFRYNNPDALLVLLLVVAAYALVRALEKGSTWWLVLAGSCIGFGFLTKMLQALVIVPAMGLVYLIAGPPKLGRRIRQLLIAGLAIVVSAGWWVAAVQLIPAADRPYIGGSQDNSLLNLIFGYNGFGRITGNETGSVGGGPTGTSMWGPTGWTRMFNSSFGTQASWLIPAALIVLAAVLWMTVRAPRRDRTRAAFILWGGWLLVTAAVFSFAQGIIHPYYTVALAPAIGALVGMGTVHLWTHRDRWFSRGTLAAVTVLTAVWSFVMLARTPSWFPWLRGLVLAVGIVATIGILAAPLVGRSLRRTAAVLGVGAALAGPLFFTVDAVATPASGAIPSAGPTSAQGGPGGFGGGFPGRFGRGGGSLPGLPAGVRPPAGIRPGAGGLPGGAGLPPTIAGGRFARGNGRFGAGGAAGGLLGASTPSAALVKALQSDASRYAWVAAAIGANTAAGYQLGSGDPVMAIGGFNGTDPAPSLASFKALVAQGKIHYFIASGFGAGGAGPLAQRFAGGPGAGGTGQSQQSRVSSTISTWVESHFTSVSIGGTTLYDLTKPIA